MKARGSAASFLLRTSPSVWDEWDKHTNRHLLFWFVCFLLLQFHFYLFPVFELWKGNRPDSLTVISVRWTQTIIDVLSLFPLCSVRPWHINISASEVRSLLFYLQSICIFLWGWSEWSRGGFLLFFCSCYDLLGLLLTLLSILHIEVKRKNTSRN